MKIKTIELKNIKELNQDLINTIIEKNRDINVDYDWYSIIQEDYIKKLNDIGFIDAEINFSGFWSQGDGASFDCSNLDFELLLNTIKKDLTEKEYNRILKFYYIDNETFNFYIEKNQFANHYYHKKTRYIDLDWYNDKWYKLDLLKDLQNKVLDLLEELRLDLCGEIYKSLREEYEYLISDDCILETLIINNYYFDSDGEMEGI